MNELHSRYTDKGLVILGVPCNQFGHQVSHVVGHWGVVFREVKSSSERIQMRFVFFLEYSTVKAITFEAYCVCFFF